MLAFNSEGEKEIEKNCDKKEEKPLPTNQAVYIFHSLDCNWNDILDIVAENDLISLILNFL